MRATSYNAPNVQSAPESASNYGLRLGVITPDLEGICIRRAPGGISIKGGRLVYQRTEKDNGAWL